MLRYFEQTTSSKYLLGITYCISYLSYLIYKNIVFYLIITIIYVYVARYTNDDCQYHISYRNIDLMFSFFILNIYIINPIVIINMNNEIEMLIR